MFGRATGPVECRGARRTSRFSGPVTPARTIRGGCGVAISVLVSNLALMTLNAEVDLTVEERNQHRTDEHVVAHEVHGDVARPARETG